MRQSCEYPILADNRHICCICHKNGKDVQLHHIDGKPSNNSPENLCVLCLDCHGKVERKPTMARQITSGELRIYKNNWEKHCRLEKNKSITINNYFGLYARVPELRDPEVMQPFFSRVGSAATMNSDSLAASIDSTSSEVQFTISRKLSDKDLALLFKHGIDWGEED